MADADHSEALASFVAITDATEAVAQQLLAATGFEISAAVELYFASQAAEADADEAYARSLAAGGGGGGGGFGGGDGGGGGGGGGGDDFGDEAVRAPQPRYMDTLRGPAYALGPHAHVAPVDLLPQRAASGGLGGGDAGALAAAMSARAHLSHLSAFRDFEAEGFAGGDDDDDDEGADPDEAGGEAGEAGGAGAGVGAPPRPRRARAAAGPDAGLAGLFAPPTRLLYAGSVEQARAAAGELDRWLLVNVQSNAEFGSHMLNRDTWAHDTVASLVEGSFVFVQLYDMQEEGARAAPRKRARCARARRAARAPRAAASALKVGCCRVASRRVTPSVPSSHARTHTPTHTHLGAGRKMLTFHQLLHSPLPVTLLLDPITGAKMHSFVGFVSPEKFLEACVPFCDAPPSASAGPHKKHKHAAAAVSAPPAQRGAGGAEEEDDALAAAIAASLAEADARGGGGGGGGAAGGASGSAAAAAPAAAPAVVPSGRVGFAAAAPPPAPAAAEPAPEAPSFDAAAAEAAAAALAATLPAELSAGDASACRVALRLPDGGRAARVFSRDAPVAALRTWAAVAAPTAALGRPFRLVASGGPPLPEDEAGTSIGAAGLANAMINMSWL
jgi:hypothetical protein